MFYDFVILYEVPQRELESVALISYELERRGYTCAVINAAFVNPSILRKQYRNKVKVLIVESLYGDGTIANLVYRIFGKVPQIVNLRWEQIYTNENEGNQYYGGYPHERATDAWHICWGGGIRKNLIKSGVKPAKAVMTGPVHMDFLRPEFSQFYLDKEHLFKLYGLAVDCTTVLFISSFSYTDISSYQKSVISRQLRINKTETINEFISLSRKSKMGILCWIEKLLLDHNDLQFIYRPHPMEKQDKALFELEKKYPNFRVISEFSVKQWILACDLIYNWYSTAAAEAFFAGKSTFLLRPYAISHNRDIPFFTGLKTLESYKDFSDSLQSNCKPIISSAIIFQYYDVDETLFSYVRLCNFLEELIKKNIEPFKWDKDLIIKCKKYAIKQRIYYSIHRLACTIYAFFTERMGLPCFEFADIRLKNYRDEIHRIEKLDNNVLSVKERLSKIINGKF